MMKFARALDFRMALTGWQISLYTRGCRDYPSGACKAIK